MSPNDKLSKINFTITLDEYFELALQEVTAKLKPKFVSGKLKISIKQAKSFIAFFDTLRHGDRREGEKRRGLANFSVMYELGVIHKNTYEALSQKLKGTVVDDVPYIREIDHNFLQNIKWSLKEAVAEEEIRDIYRVLNIVNPSLSITAKDEKRLRRRRNAAWGVLSQEKIGQKYGSLDALFQTAGVPLTARQRAEDLLKDGGLKTRAILSLRRHASSIDMSHTPA